MSRRTTYIGSIYLLFWTVLLYYRFTNGYFVGEDYNYLTYARYPLSVSPLDPFYTDYFCGMWFRPVALMLWLVSWRLAGLAAWAHYAIDAVVLWLGALMLVRLCRQLGTTLGAAFVVAAIFIAHPISGATFSYLAARGDILGTFFALASLSLHIQSRSSPNIFPLRLAAILAAVAAFLSKEMFLIIPLMVMVIPFKGAHEKRLRRWADHFIEGVPYLLVAIGVFIWRDMVIGDALGGYIYKRSAVSFFIVKTPSRFLQTAILTPKMMAVYGKYLLQSPVARLMITLMGLGGLIAWLMGGLGRFRSPHAKMALAWTVISILPLANFPDVLEVSPRLLFFPLAMFMIWLSALKPGPIRLAPITAIILLLAWIPLNWKIGTVELQKADRFRKLGVATQEFYLPQILNGRDAQTIAVFGLPDEVFTLSLVFLNTLPRDLDIYTCPAFTVRLMPGDRGTYIAFIHRAGDPPPAEGFQDAYDFGTRDRIKIFDSAMLYSEHVKAPDILKLMLESKDIKVGYYDAAKNRYQDVTDIFQQINFLRKIALEQTTVFPEWTVKMALYTWMPNDQFEKLLGDTSLLYRSKGNDPYLKLSDVLIDPLPILRFDIKMRIKRPNLLLPPVQDAFLSWESEKKPPFVLKQIISFPIKADGEWHTYEVNVGALPGWYLGERVTSLRLDPVSTLADVELESIITVPYPAPKAAP